MSQNERTKRVLASSEDGDGNSVELTEYGPLSKTAISSVEGVSLRITAKPWADGSKQVVQLQTCHPEWEPLYVVRVGGESVLNTYVPRIAWDKFNTCIGLDTVGA